MIVMPKLSLDNVYPKTWETRMWPAGKRCAVVLSFAFDAETIWFRTIMTLKPSSSSPDGGFLCIVMHPQVIGRRSRMAMLERLIQHMLRTTGSGLPRICRWHKPGLPHIPMRSNGVWATKLGGGSKSLISGA